MKSREKIWYQLDLLDLRTWTSTAEKFSPGHIWPRPSGLIPFAEPLTCDPFVKVLHQFVIFRFSRSNPQTVNVPD